MPRVKISFVVTLLALVALFTIQNTEQVEVNFLFWHLSLSRALLLFLVYVVGILTGFILSLLKFDIKAENDQPPQSG